MFAVSPTVTHFQDEIECGEKISGELFQHDDEHWYAMHVEWPGWDLIEIHLCVTNSPFQLILRQKDKTIIGIERYTVVKDTGGGGSGIGGSFWSVDDCDSDLYVERMDSIDALSLPIDEYLIEVSYYKDPVDLVYEEAKYELRVLCKYPSDIYEILQPLPLLSWSWSDAFDDPNCQNPANISWCAENSYNSSSFVQVDLGATYFIYSITTFDCYYPNWKGDIKWSHEWVNTYYLEYSLDASLFYSYTGNPLTAGQVLGEESILNPPITANVLRFVPFGYENAKRMMINAKGKSYV